MTTRIMNHAIPTKRKSITAAAMMKPNPRSISRNATVRETAEILHGHGLHIAPVIDDAGRPVGVVSRTDLLDYWGRRRDRLAAVAAGETMTTLTHLAADSPGDELTVRKIMTPVVFGVRMNAPIGNIVEKMAALEVRCLFVTDEGGVLVGTVSVFDVIRRLAQNNASNTYVETHRSEPIPAVLDNSCILASAMPP